jgi:hypothetical protein
LIPAVAVNGHTSLAASPWHERAEELAQWTLDRLVNRTDVWGGYEESGTVTRPKVRHRGEELLAPATLWRHYTAECREHIMGTHSGSPGPESTAKWIAGDIDLHDDDPPENAEANPLRPCPAIP